MGTDGCEVVETLPNPRSFKVHRKICTDLRKLVDKISRIFPDIEAARPRCSSGIQSLCLLNSAINKAKLLLQHCFECSQLYLAMTGDAILSRCEKARKSLEQSLVQIQGMVPVMLAAEISQIIDELGCTTFILDPVEEEVGRVVRELLQQGASASDSMENSEINSLQFAAVRLNITSAKAILTEKRSIKKLLDKVGSNDQTKRMILKYLLYLLKKYENLIIGEQMEKVYSRSEGPIATENPSDDPLCSHHVESDPCWNDGQCRTDTSEFGRIVPPQEYQCPISSKLMYDPVIIASGVTYERLWIQKWFDDGNDKCPKSKNKLDHTALTPNMVMKDLISKWCRTNGVSIPDPSRQAEDFRPWEASSTSIRSFGSSMNDLMLPVDLSNMSLGSLDTSYGSDSSHAKTTCGSNLMLIKTSDNSQSRQSHADIHDTDLMLLSKLHDLQWDSQCQVIEDMKNYLKCNHQAFCSALSENFVEPLMRFLGSAYELHDIKALRAGIQLLLEFVHNCKNSLTDLSEDACSMLASFLDSEVVGEALSIIEEISGYWCGKANIAASIALTSVLKILDSSNREFQQQALRIMYNLSFNGEICPNMLSLDCIPKLLPFFKDRALLRYCICILKNLCDTEVGRATVAGTKGCISSVAEILETEGDAEKEHALAVLISLCSQRVDYCQLVMHEGIIPSLVELSVTGNEKEKASASELLRLLRDVKYDENEVCFETSLNTTLDSNNHFQEKKSSKRSSLFNKLPKFSKSSSHASKHKR